MNKRRNWLSSTGALATLLALIGLGTAVNAHPPMDPPSPASAEVTLDKIAPTLRALFTAQPSGAQLEYWVILQDQADTTNTIPTSRWADKGWYVYNTLISKANSTQGPLLAQLTGLQNAGSVRQFQSFWIINSFMVTGDLASAQALASSPAVSVVRDPGQFQILDDSDTPPALSQAAISAGAQTAAEIASAPQSLVPLLVQHNINEVRAPQAWALGYDGTGIVVGSMDTGVRWTHEALNARYRGVVAPPDPSALHDYNWFDGYNVFTTPTDSVGHGSHTMGTLLGTSPNGSYGNIGVAKGAQWITVRICATTTCDGTPILNGFQWTLAPTRVNGTQARPDLRPMVSSNSWGGSACSVPSWQIAITNWVNAGIFPDFATGNSGPGAGTVVAPASYVNAWGTGNLNTSTSNWVINNGSSRGPSCFDGSIRPHAIAPGTNICSSINTSDTAYDCTYTGTSMATPHIAGAVAVLKQKNPGLTVAQYMFAITSTAFFSPTWGMRPNNDYGWGLLQLDAALNAIPSQGTTSPTVTLTPLGGSTPTRTATHTPTVGATNTPTTVSATTTRTAVSATQAPTVAATATVCPIQFSDVSPGDPFYPYIRCLACRNIISGYTTSPPCAAGGTPCYNGGANVTRGQVAKIVANAAGYADPIPSTQQTFTDVPYTNPFWVYIERLAEPGRSFISGYSTSPPCTTGTPCFLPFNNVTRGQMAKIDANAGGFFDAIPSTQQTFTDVPYSSPFWVYVERASLHGVISGYSTSPPCPGGTPCFLPGNDLTRNQAAKVVASTFYPNCQTPARSGNSASP